MQNDDGDLRPPLNTTAFVTLNLGEVKMRLAAIGGLARPAYLWQAARIFAACAISYAIPLLIGLEEPYWAPIAAIYVAQPELQATFAAGRDRVIATLIGAVIGLAVLQANRSGMHSMPLFWGVLIPLSILSAVKPNMRPSCTTLVILVLVPSTGPVLARPFERFLEILLGTLVAIAVTAATPKKQRLSQPDAG
jgi:uncharacterized membrane protein YccC